MLFLTYKDLLLANTFYRCEIWPLVEVSIRDLCGV